MKTRIAAVGLVLILVGACASLLPPLPRDPREAVMVAEEEWQVVVKTYADLLEAGIVSREEDDKLWPLVAKSREVRDALWASLRMNDEAAVGSGLEELRRSLLLLRRGMEEAR